jgi:hypothetical protein
MESDPELAQPLYSNFNYKPCNSLVHFFLRGVNVFTLDSNEHYFRSRNLALPQDSHSLRGTTRDLWTVFAYCCGVTLYRLRFLFGRSRVSFSAQRPEILCQAFPWFSSVLTEKWLDTTLKKKHDCFLPKHYSVFITIFSYNLTFYDIPSWDSMIFMSESHGGMIMTGENRRTRR